MDWGNVVTAFFALIVGLTGGWFTRRTAKESNKSAADATAVTGFDALTKRLDEQNTRQEARIKGLEQREEAERHEKEERERAQREAARAHERWDQELVAKLNEFTHEPFRPPPPLWPLEG